MLDGNRCVCFRGLLIGVVCLCAATMSAAAVRQGNPAGEADAAAAQSENADEVRQLVASSDKLRLYFTGGTQLLEIEESDGHIWKSAVDPALYQDLELSELWQSNLSALFHFTYYNSGKSDKANTLSGNSLSKGVKLTQSALEDNGISLKFSFTEIKISLTLEIRLDGDAIRLTIPEDLIKETGEYSLASVTPLPFLGAAANGSEGYTVYPDGSGALHRFNRSTAKNASALSVDLYGPRAWESATMNQLDQAAVKTAMLPIFGMCSEGHTFVAIVEDEALESSVEVCQSGVSVPFERIANVFTIRRSYTVVQPDVKGGEATVVKMEQGLIPGERSILYAFLPQGSGYSGMANRYREYLLEKDELPKRIDKDDDVPLMLDLFMGVSESQILFDKYIAMTDFEAAERILTELSEGGVTDIRANLVGWQEGGYDAWPKHFPAESKLGGNKALQGLNEWASAADITLTLQENYILAKNGNGINRKADCVYTKGSLLLTNQATDLYLMRPLKTGDIFEKNLAKARSSAVRGFAFDGIGKYLYPDYNGKNSVTRAQTGKVWRDMLQKTQEEMGYVCLDGGNAFLLSEVDFLHHIPVQDSAYFLTDETIPLYQMVVHGYIPYTTEEPENLFYDSRKQWLRMLEYGAVPYFQLTENSSGELVNTVYNFLFTSRFEQWKEGLFSSVSKYNAHYKALYSSPMTEHKRLSDEIVRVTYENGTRLYVNYGDADVQVDNVTVNAMDALVV